MKRKKQKPSEAQRVLHLHATFVSSGSESQSDLADFIQFQELYLEAHSIQTNRRLAEVRARERKLKERAALLPKFTKILHALFSDQIDATTAGRRIKRACPDEKVRREMFDFLTTPSTKPPMNEGQLAVEESRLAETQVDIERTSRVLRAWEQATRSLQMLHGQAIGGQEDAIKDLAEVAEQAIKTLMIAEKAHPDAVRNVARNRLLWPMLASKSSAWEQAARKRIERLKLGEGLEWLQVPFREARGADENYPARQWAKTAVRTIEHTRMRQLQFGEYREGFEKLVFDRGVDFSMTPEWAGKASRLQPLSRESVREWGKVIREMIREQVPEFHTLPAWTPQRNTARNTGRDKRGEIQNAILDDIVSALKSLVPSKNVPKSAC